MPEPHRSFTCSYQGTAPGFAGKPAFVGLGASVLGRATLGRGAWLDDFCVIRADGHDVVIGDDVHLGARATVHIAHDLYPTHIGHRVTAGPGAVIHACTVGDDCVIEHGAIILDGSTIGAGAVITAGSVVFPRSGLEGGWLYAGNPAKPAMRLSPAELDAHHLKIRNDHSTKKTDDPLMPSTAPLKSGCFVAPSARLSGQIETGTDVGIWYGCVLKAGAHKITVGDGTNIQDNTSIFCENSDVLIGPNVTLGHNVTLTDARVEPDSLIGIGSVLSSGTIVESDVLLAAGAETEPGQRLTSGQVWAGRPARPIGRMDDRKRGIVAGTLPMYRAYAIEFARASHKPLGQD